MFRIYESRVFVNDMWFTEIWIDSHYELKHRESINDKLILELLSQLNFKTFVPQEIRQDGFQFFATNVECQAKPYRLIWIIPPDKNYLGVRNAHRRSI